MIPDNLRQAFAGPVEAATPAQWAPIADVLADAFRDDPVMGWLLPNRDKRPTALRRIFAIEARDVALGHHSSLVAAGPAGIVGAALILPPGKWRPPMRVEARNSMRFAPIFGRRFGHAGGLVTALEMAHVRYRHYYLAFCGVAATSRGRGVGGALLTELARCCDDEGMPAYLEASSPDNARLYRRHGFRTLRTVRPLGAPPIELMLRQPQPRSC
jgi:GNAT superfamily N-acetyltransferase